MLTIVVARRIGLMGPYFLSLFYDFSIMRIYSLYDRKIFKKVGDEKDPLSSQV